jgi:hypothetical protein
VKKGTDSSLISNHTNAWRLTEIKVAYGGAGCRFRAILYAREEPVFSKILVPLDIGADTIVIASHDPFFVDYLIGSVAAKVARHAHYSVLVFREPDG